jgi:hypothetical protein
MNNDSSPQVNKDFYYRIVALWAACEGFLGGVIHGFNFPGTGLVISSGAVICISFLGYYFPQKGIILKATILVAIFKMMLSPHSPPTAYVAVFFQGLMGEMLFNRYSSFKISCILLGVLALAESAIQRILVLTIVSGTDLWKAINIFLTKLTGSSNNYSWWIAVSYVSLHILVGLWIGFLAAKLPAQIQHNNKGQIYSTGENLLPGSNKKGNKIKKGLTIFLLILLVLWLQAEFKIGKPVLPAILVSSIVVRTIIILSMWYFLAAPLLSSILKRWLQNKQYALKNDVEGVLKLMPSIKENLSYSWRESKTYKRIKRITVFTSLIFQNIFR